MRKNLHDRILKGESKEQHLSTVPKSCAKHILFYRVLKSNIYCSFSVKFDLDQAVIYQIPQPKILKSHSLLSHCHQLALNMQGGKIAFDHCCQVHHLQPPPTTLFSFTSADPLTSASALLFMWNLSIMCHTSTPLNYTALLLLETY